MLLKIKLNFTIFFSFDNETRKIKTKKSIGMANNPGKMYKMDIFWRI